MISSDWLVRVNALRGARERRTGCELAQCRRNHRAMLARRDVIEAEIAHCLHERRALCGRLGELSVSGLWAFKLDEQQLEQRRLDLRVELAALAEQIDEAAAQHARALHRHGNCVAARERFARFAMGQQRLRTCRNDSIDEEFTEEMAYAR